MNDTTPRGMLPPPRDIQILDETAGSREIDPAAYIRGMLAQPTRTQILGDCLNSLGGPVA